MKEKLFVFLHGFWFDKYNNSTSIEQIKQAFPERKFTGFNALHPSGRARWWYARYLKTQTWEKDYQSFEENITYLKKEINKELEKNNLTWKDLILCWRSQGAYTALHLWLTNEEKCDTIISLCGFTDKYTTQKISGKEKHPNIIRFEAKNDTVLDKERLESYTLLEKNNIPYTYILDNNSDHDNLSVKGIENIIKTLTK